MKLASSIGQVLVEHQHRGFEILEMACVAAGGDIIRQQAILSQNNISNTVL